MSYIFRAHVIRDIEMSRKQINNIHSSDKKVTIPIYQKNSDNYNSKSNNIPIHILYFRK